MSEPTLEQVIGRGPPAERRCRVWWGENNAYGLDKGEMLSANVCGRKFISEFPANACDECSQAIAGIDAERAQARLRKQAEARELQLASKGKRKAK